MAFRQDRGTHPIQHLGLDLVIPLNLPLVILLSLPLVILLIQLPCTLLGLLLVIPQFAPEGQPWRATPNFIQAS